MSFGQLYRGEGEGPAPAHRRSHDCGRSECQRLYLSVAPRQPPSQPGDAVTGSAAILETNFPSFYKHLCHIDRYGDVRCHNMRGIYGDRWTTAGRGNQVHKVQDSGSRCATNMGCQPAVSVTTSSLLKVECWAFRKLS